MGFCAAPIFYQYFTFYHNDYIGPGCTTISNLSQPTLEIVNAFIMCFSMKKIISQAFVRAVSKDEIETVESLLSSGVPPNPLSSEVYTK